MIVLDTSALSADMHGATTAVDRLRLQAPRDVILVAPVADELGRQKARLARLGHIIEDFDLAIGSIALVLDAGLATSNSRQMERIRGLTVQDWGLAVPRGGAPGP